MKFKKLAEAFSGNYIRSRYYKRVLLAFLLGTCAVALLFCGILLYSSNRDFGKALDSAQESILNQSLSINQTNLADITTYCNNLLSNPDMQAVFYGNDLTAAQIYSAAEMNTSFRSMSSLILSAYFINFRTGTIMDQNGRVPIENHPDQDIFERLERMTPGRYAALCVPRLMDYSGGGYVRTGKRVISLIFYFNSSGALVVNLSGEDYASLFAVDAGEHIALTMVNSAGEIFLSTNPEDFGRDVSDNSMYAAIRALSNSRGVYTYSDGESVYYVHYAKNQGLGITYICSRERLPFYSDNGQLAELAWCGVTLLLVGIVLSLVLSRLVYDPLNRLKQAVAKARPSVEGPGANMSSGDDIGYLFNAYREMAETNSRLRENSSALRNTALLGRLLYDVHDSGKQVSAADLEALDASFPETSYAVLVLGLDPAGEPAMEEALMLYAIQNVTQELLSETVVAHHVATNSEFVIFILNFDKPEPEKIREILKRSQDFIAENFHVSFSAGLGDTVKDLGDLNQSFRGAQMALSMRFLTGYRSFHTSGELTEAAVTKHGYSAADAQIILDGVHKLSESEVRRGIDGFFEHFAGCGIDEIMSSILRLHFNLQRLESQNYIAAEGEWSSREMEKRTLAEVQDRILNRCLEDIRQLSAIREISSGRKELVDRTCALVEENIYNPELTASFLADKVHLSVNYLRTIFKDYMGESLSGYINRKKIELICRILVDTDMTLSEISDKLGFSASSYFYAFFKKHVGMTPGDYRKKMKLGGDLTVDKIK